MLINHFCRQRYSQLRLYRSFESLSGGPQQTPSDININRSDDDEYEGQHYCAKCSDRVGNARCTSRQGAALDSRK